MNKFQELIEKLDVAHVKRKDLINELEQATKALKAKETYGTYYILRKIDTHTHLDRYLLNDENEKQKRYGTGEEISRWLRLREITDDQVIISK